MSRQISALILDDDVWSLRLMAGMLLQCFPDLEVQPRSEPDPTGDFDIYFVDNYFNDTPVAVDLATKIRADHTESLIVAFSGSLDASTLRQLVNAGCNGVCDKSDPSDLPRVMEVVGKFIDELTVPVKAQNHGFVGAMGAVSNLLREWNSRLDNENR